MTTVTATIRGGSIGGGSAVSGSGLAQGLFRVVKTFANNTIDLSDYYTSIYLALARVDSSGADDPCTVSGTTVTMTTGTGTATVNVWGTPISN